MQYRIQLDSLKRNFPDGFGVPSLLEQFTSWMQNHEKGSLGWFSLESERFNDYWMVNGADLHEKFAFFMRDPSGGQIGFWLHDGVATEHPPIVLIGSEGETQLLGDDLLDFLQKLGRGETGHPDLDEIEDENNSIRQEFLAFLEHECRNRDENLHNDYPDFEEWMSQKQNENQGLCNSDPTHLEIAEILRKYRSPIAEIWQCDVFEVVMVGDLFAVWHRHFGLKRLADDEVAVLKPLFQDVRRRRALNYPERGHWLQASVEVGKSGGAWLRCEFLGRPEVDDTDFEIPEDEFKKEFQKWPRSGHWQVDWLR